MSEIWYHWHEYVGWVKLKHRPDLSGLDDMFEYVDTFEPFYRNGMRLSVEYGCLNKLMESGDFMTEENFILYKPEMKTLTKL
jgi:hypothetical protein